MGLIKIRRGDFPAAIAFIQEANALYRDMGNHYRLATNNANLGIIYRQGQHLSPATDKFIQFLGAQ